MSAAAAPAKPEAVGVVSWLFLRLLGLVSLLAFLSLLPQLRGLVGAHGISPATELLDAAKAQLGAERFRVLPTLLWAGASDAALLRLCWAGAAASLLLLLGLVPTFAAAASFACYLSITAAGQEFLQYQWDALLLEALPLAVLLSPLAWRDRPGAPRPRATVWLLRWLVFRLMLGSGLVKVESGDPLWRHFLALTVHYETQPLPTPLAFFAHQAPVWFHRLSAFAMFLIEICLPFLVFAGRRGRQIAFAGFVALQLLIAATGNYGIFNLLTIVLCLTLLADDDLPGRLRAALAREPAPAARTWPKAVLWPAAALLWFLTVVQISRVTPVTPLWPREVIRAANWFAPLRVANLYGLFAVMTNPRWEVVLEGSDDGIAWSEIPFRWKPQDVTKAPPVVAPYMPRLDWQMWFAALAPSAEAVPWFASFLRRLLEGEPAVWGLLARGPFGPDRPPRYLRAMKYEMHFTDVKTLRATGCWWRRTQAKVYLGPVTRGDGS